MLPSENLAQTAPSPVPTPVKPRRARKSLVVALLLLTTGVFALALLPPAAFHEHLQALEVVAPTPGHFDAVAASAWQQADLEATQRLNEAWPGSIFQTLGESVALWLHSLALHRSIEPSERGYQLYDVGIAGQIHLVDAARRARWSVLLGRGDKESHAEAFTQYWGQSIDSSARPFPVRSDTVNAILESLAIDDSVFRGLRIYLLPFALQDVAGLGAHRKIVLGAAPNFRSATLERTVYALMHELGHHIHFRYVGPYTPLWPHRWNEYMELREMAVWASSGSAGSPSWQESTEETFAEDFRVLFTPRSLPIAPHATIYDDPRTREDGGAALRQFIESLW